ncbi:hypothetical protein [Flammeovirga sp. OC4]|uniref:hypothetical protein n=1 Tax=Flammeovirga sp. OC4 TaxID=1382345 RepID=UPI0005C4EB21|nr:hypothetical protein [Flammeovirga sp. OC4]
MTKPFLFTLLLINISINTFGCTCKYYGGFAFANQIADIIVQGKVLNYKCDENLNFTDCISMNFEVKKIFRGQVFKDTILVYGDNGMACRPYIDKFKIGEEWLLALNKLDSNYEILICGELALKFKNKSYSGKIYSRQYRSHEDLITKKELLNVINSPYKYPLNTVRCYQNDQIIKMIDYYNYPLTKFSLEELSIKLSSELMKIDQIKKIEFKHLFHLNMSINKNGKLEFLCIERDYEGNINEDLGLSYWCQKVLIEKMDFTIECRYPLKYPEYVSIPIIIGNN